MKNKPAELTPSYTSRNEVKLGASLAKPRAIVGAGFVALDYILTNDDPASARVLAGGTCGNVTAILAFLGWKSHPVARLGTGANARTLRKDLEAAGADLSFLRSEPSGSTPIILHRIHRLPNQPPRHRFSTRCPDCGHWYPPFKPFTKLLAKRVEEALPTVDVFFFDRATPANIDLAKHYQEQGALVYFEPNGVRDVSLFQRACQTAHVIKYSQDQLMDHADLVENLAPPLRIETSGADGLRFRLRNKDWLSMAAVQAPVLRDAAGAGDWLTAGFLNHAIREGQSPVTWKVKDVRAALAQGQALAALNCAFEGARGAMYGASADDLLQTANVLQAHKPNRLGTVRSTRLAPKLCGECATQPRQTQVPTNRISETRPKRHVKPRRS